MNRRKPDRPLRAGGHKPKGGMVRARSGARTIELPPPHRRGGTSVLAALNARKTVREISASPVPRGVLSDLLWAAFGVNRRLGPFGQPGRTAASASNAREIDIYVALAEGVYLYEPPSHSLVPVAAGDLREKAISRGQRGTAASRAPVNLIYVADIARYRTAGFQEPGLWDAEVQKSYSSVATGLIAGNVYLFAAANGLAAWFHNCDREALAEALKLRPGQRVLYGQTVGYPARR
jgi:nitroreductase